MASPCCKRYTTTATELSENGLLYPTYVGGATGTTGPAVGPATGSGDDGVGVSVVEADEVGAGVAGGAVGAEGSTGAGVSDARGVGAAVDGAEVVGGGVLGGAGTWS